MKKSQVECTPLTWFITIVTWLGDFQLIQSNCVTVHFKFKLLNHHELCVTQRERLINYCSISLELHKLAKLTYYMQKQKKSYFQR